MHANVTTWSLHDPVRSDEALDRFLADIAPAAVAGVGSEGLQAVFAVRSATDQLLTVAVYATAQQASAGSRQIGGTLRSLLTGRATVVDVWTGPAWDLHAVWLTGTETNPLTPHPER